MKKVFTEVSEFNLSNLYRAEEWLAEQVKGGYKTVIIEVLDE